ncbi:MAG: hypothetical protein Q9220_004158 [cf. Caloplaca sp. 1 TL-2023]
MKRKSPKFPIEQTSLFAPSYHHIEQLHSVIAPLLTLRMYTTVQEVLETNPTDAETADVQEKKAAELQGPMTFKATALPFKTNQGIDMDVKLEVLGGGSEPVDRRKIPLDDETLLSGLRFSLAACRQRWEASADARQCRETPKKPILLPPFDFTVDLVEVDLHEMLHRKRRAHCKWNQVAKWAPRLSPRNWQTAIKGQEGVTWETLVDWQKGGGLWQRLMGERIER